MKLAITYAPQTFDFRGKIMGRQAAGFGFLRAMAGSNWDEVGCYAASEQLARCFADDLGALSCRPARVRYVPFAQPADLAQFDVLYRPDPSLGDDAWSRQHRSGARAYSLCGVTHTLSSRGAMNALSALPDVPLYSWDAVICTSRVARDVVLRLVEGRAEHLRRRFGAAAVPMPQFPLIPLGVHVADFIATPAVRTAARDFLGLAPEEVTVLFAGRLTFHAKAHPLPMFVGLERARAAAGLPVALVIFGQFPNGAIADAFKREAAQLAPSVRLVVLDGAEATNAPRAWAAADIFTSLSDNIQETFGLTPVEAMAAGLPCVVSDWDGYKDTVRNGIDGFRVPTYAPPPGCGGDLGDRFELGLVDYDRYIGEVSLFTAVDVASAAEAYRRLIMSPELRRTMGETGRRRATEIYDWGVVFRRYVALWEDLGERRRSDPRVLGEESRARRPDRPDPFDLFRTFPTAAIGPDTRARLGAAGSVEQAAEEALARKRLDSVGYAAPVLPGDAVLACLVAALAVRPEGMTVGDLQMACSPIPLGGVIRSLGLLAKLGVVDLEAHS